MQRMTWLAVVTVMLCTMFAMSPSAGATVSAHYTTPENNRYITPQNNTEDLEAAGAHNRPVFTGTVNGATVTLGCSEWIQQGVTETHSMTFPLDAPGGLDTADCNYRVATLSSGWGLKASVVDGSNRAALIIPKGGITMAIDDCTLTFAPTAPADVSGELHEHQSPERVVTDGSIPVSVSAGCTASATFVLTVKPGVSPGFDISN